MANWHARTGDNDGNSFLVIYHIPIPSVNNRVGVNYRTALIGSNFGGRTQMTEGVSPGSISTAEKTQILAGEIYEYQEIIQTNPSETLGQLQAKIDNRYNELVTILQSRLQKQLTYWGHDRTI